RCEGTTAEQKGRYHQRCASARQIFLLSHIAERISCSGVAKLQRESGAGMTNKFLLNDAKHWRTRAKKARGPPTEKKAFETKNALVRIGENYEHFAKGVEDWAVRRLSRN